MVDLEVDLLPIGVVIGAVGQTEGGGVVSAAEPLMHCRIQAIPAIKRIGVRHDGKVSLCDAGGILHGSSGIPGCSGNLSVGAVWLGGRIRYRAKDAEVAQLARVRGAVRVCRWPRWVAHCVH